MQRLALGAMLLITAGVALLFGSNTAGHWDEVLLFQNAQDFGVKDPQFHRDLGFYVFKLPMYQFALDWLLAAFIITLIGTLAVYAFRAVLYGFRVDAPRPIARHVFSVDVPRGIKVHLRCCWSALLLIFIARYYLSTFSLVYSTQGVDLGAFYTDIHANLPIIYVKMAVAAIVAVLVVGGIFRAGLLLPLGGLIVWIVVSIAGAVYPAIIQNFIVQPNEVSKEEPYLARNIEMTRYAYGLDQIDERQFPASQQATAAEVAENQDTIDNVRLWDPEPLRAGLRQIQTIRPLFDFLDVDVDRYTIDGKLRQVMLSARELDSNKLPIDAQTWVNSRLQFTHGYGYTVAAVNEAEPDGGPKLIVSDIPLQGPDHDRPPRGLLRRAGGPLHHRRWQRAGVHARERRRERADEVRGQRRHRDQQPAAQDRLRMEVRRPQHPDLGRAERQQPAHLSAQHPAAHPRDRAVPAARCRSRTSSSTRATCTGCRTRTRRPTCIPYSHRTGSVNYIRNSVKVVVNAYSGETNFYVMQPDEPLLKAYAAIFPDLFKPLDQMPATLQAAHPLSGGPVPPADAGLPALPHPATRAQFYQKEDQWDIPTEIFGSTEQTVRPYYVIARMPGETSEEFMLILPFVPLNRTNAIAWLAARSDGENYGKLVSFRFPSSVSVPGPTQVERRIDSDGRVSQQLTLWNQSGSKRDPRQPADDPDRQREPVLRAALPLGASAGGNELPQLKRVVVVNGDNIAMEPTLARAIDVIFGRAAPSGLDSTGASVASPTATPAAGATSQPATPQATPQATPASAATPSRPSAATSRRSSRSAASRTTARGRAAPQRRLRRLRRRARPPEADSSTSCNSSSARRWRSRSRELAELTPYTRAS